MKLIFILIFFCLYHLTFAANFSVICNEPQGTRVDYFLRNNIRLPNETFLQSRDGITGLKPHLKFNDQTKKVTFTIGDTQQASSEEKSGEMNVLIYDENHLSFAGMINGAPILATYYPKLNVLIYSQQSIWPAPNFDGARAILFYSKCIIQ